MADASAHQFHFWRAFFIWLFSISLVIIGALELHKRHLHKKQAVPKDPKALIQELRGDIDLKTLITNPEALQADMKAREAAQAQRRFDPKALVENVVP